MIQVEEVELNEYIREKLKHEGGDGGGTRKVTKGVYREKYSIARRGGTQGLAQDGKLGAQLFRRKEAEPG